jgi:hypothetical protein
VGRLASDADPAATVFVVDNASAFTVGKVYAIDREAVKVRRLPSRATQGRTPRRIFE